MYPISLVCKSQTLNYIKANFFRIRDYTSLIRKSDIFNFMNQTEKLMHYNKIIDITEKKSGVKFIQDPLNFEVSLPVFIHLKNIARREKYPEVYREKNIQMLKNDLCLHLHRDFLSQPRKGKIFLDDLEVGTFFVNTESNLLDFPDRYTLNVKPNKIMQY